MGSSHKMGVHTPTVGFYKMAAHTKSCVDVTCYWNGLAAHCVEKASLPSKLLEKDSNRQNGLCNQHPILQISIEQN